MLYDLAEEPKTPLHYEARQQHGPELTADVGISRLLATLAREAGAARDNAEAAHVSASRCVIFCP